MKGLIVWWECLFYSQPTRSTEWKVSKSCLLHLHNKKTAYKSTPTKPPCTYNDVENKSCKKQMHNTMLMDVRLKLENKIIPDEYCTPLYYGWHSWCICRLSWTSFAGTILANKGTILIEFGRVNIPIVLQTVCFLF